MTPAEFFDVNNNGFDIYEASIIAGLVASGFFTIRWIGHRIDERIREIAAQLDQRTEPIQPTSNHGKSLPDVSNQVVALKRDSDAALARLNQRVDWLADLVVNALTEGGGKRRKRIMPFESSDREEY